jgi:hypothetical protein
MTAAIAPRLCNELLEICLASGIAFGMNPVPTIHHAGSEHCDDDLERAKVAVPKGNQVLSNMESVVLNMNIAQDEVGEVSNAAGSADEP